MREWFWRTPSSSLGWRIELWWYRISFVMITCTGKKLSKSLLTYRTPFWNLSGFELLIFSFSYARCFVPIIDSSELPRLTNNKVDARFHGIEYYSEAFNFDIDYNSAAFACKDFSLPSSYSSFSVPTNYFDRSGSAHNQQRGDVWWFSWVRGVSNRKAEGSSAYHPWWPIWKHLPRLTNGGCQVLLLWFLKKR